MQGDDEPHVSHGNPSQHERALACAVNLVLAGQPIANVMTVLLSLFCQGADEVCGNDDAMFDRFCDSIIAAMKTARQLRQSAGATKQ